MLNGPNSLGSGGRGLWHVLFNVESCVQWAFFKFRKGFAGRGLETQVHVANSLAEVSNFQFSLKNLLVANDSPPLRSFLGALLSKHEFSEMVPVSRCSFRRNTAYVMKI